MNAEAAARARIERWRGWKSTPEYLWPSGMRSNSDRTDLDDVAAVLAGSKPAALVCVASVRPRHRSELAALLRIARMHGMDISIERDTNGMNANLLVGLPANIEGLRQLISEPEEQRAPDWCLKLGRLLGYTPDGMVDPKDVPEAERTIKTNAERIAEGLEAWNRLPRYKQFVRILRSRLSYPSDRLRGFQHSRMLKTIDHVLREPMPPEKLGHLPPYSAGRHVSRPEGSSRSGDQGRGKTA